MDKKEIVNKTVEKLAQAKNTYTSKDIANLAKEMKETSSGEEVEALWDAFAETHKVSKDKVKEIVTEKLRVLYQVDLRSVKHQKILEQIISDAEKRETWT